MSNESQGTNVLTIGRIVWVVGNLYTGRVKTDEDTRQPVISTKTNQPVQEYGFGLAIPKNLFTVAGPQGAKDLWDAMMKEAMGIYPSGQFPPDFAWKFKDCDQNDQNGQPYRLRKGYEGCMVIACTTQMPIKFYRFENGQNVQVSEGIKCGDYVEVSLSVKGHPPKGRGKAGLYINPNLVRFNSWGEEIINTPDGNAIFGATAPVMAPGGSAVPLAVPSPMPSMQAPQFQQPAPVPQMPAPPHHGVLPPQYQPQQAAPAFPQPGGFPVPQPSGAHAPVNGGYPSAPAAPMHGAPVPSFAAPNAMGSPVAAQMPPAPGGFNPQQQFPGGMPFPGQR